jgi:hypothetical protein
LDQRRWVLEDICDMVACNTRQLRIDPGHLAWRQVDIVRIDAAKAM